MDTAHRRMEIISILSARGHTTMRELAWELDVSRRTIMNDVIALSFDYPVYTKPGEGGGVFITEKYKPYTNTLTLTEQKTLCGLYDKAEGKEKEILFRIIHKYGADNGNPGGAPPPGRRIYRHGSPGRYAHRQRERRSRPFGRLQGG